VSEIAWTYLGWFGTAIFVSSFLVKDRENLHLLGLVGSVIKLAYTYHFGLWPLVVNWILLVVIETVQWVRFRRSL